MLVWSTSFPVPSRHTALDLFDIAARTLDGSQHHPWTVEDFKTRPNNEILTFSKKDQVVELAHLVNEDKLWTGVRHIAPVSKDSEVWETTVVIGSSEIPV